MAGTKQFITASVGVQGKNRNADVRALQQLLIAAGEKVPGGDDGDGRQHAQCASELSASADAGRGQGVHRKGDRRAEGRRPVETRGEVADLDPLPGKTGLAGIEAMHTWFVDNDIVYQQGAEDGGGTRCVYGVEGETGYAVQTESKAFRKGPVQMDCTTYANLMLSVYLYGKRPQHCVRRRLRGASAAQQLSLCPRPLRLSDRDAARQGQNRQEHHGVRFPHHRPDRRGERRTRRDCTRSNRPGWAQAS
jgi:hypothetical protein